MNIISLGLAAVALIAGSELCGAQVIGDERPGDPEAIPRPEVRAVPTDGEIVMDGIPDEPVWLLADSITAFVQAQPNTGAPASERTVVRLLYDQDRLYISAYCYDSYINGIIVKTLERDYPGVLSEDMDSFGISFDTFLDRRNSFLFFVNPRGGVKDGQGFNDGTSRDYGWDGVVDVKTALHDFGWTVEMAIPWSTLRFDPGNESQTWGANFLRRVRRKNEVSYWAPLGRRDRIFLMSRAGTVRGLPSVQASRNLTVKPFALARRSTGMNLSVGDTGNDGDAGLDIKYGITPRVTLDLTFRTDFSQADVDQEQVNLTRFPVFFPEQRDFFLENSGIFTLGDVTAPGAPRSGTSTRDFTLFHSRTIGLRGGSPVPLFGGARLTGRVGSFEFGALNVQSESAANGPAENFTAIRLRRNILGTSDIGFLFTNREATESGATGYNRSFGTDVNLRLAQFLRVNSYLALSSQQGAEDEAARLSVGWRDRIWDASAQVRHIGGEFSPGMGFVRRRGIRQWYATFGAHPRPDIHALLEINPYGEVEYVTDLDGNRLSWEGTLGMGVTFRDGGSLTLRYADRQEVLDEPFTVRSGATVPDGNYHFEEVSAQYRASEGRKISGSVRISGGGFFSGNRFSLAGEASWQPNYHLTFETSAEHNSISLAGTTFSADLYSWRIKYAFSTTLYFRGFVQYNVDLDQTVTNVRVNLVHAPLSDIFLVFTERRDLKANAILERFITAKVTKLFAL